MDFSKILGQDEDLEGYDKHDAAELVGAISQMSGAILRTIIETHSDDPEIAELVEEADGTHKALTELVTGGHGFVNLAVLSLILHETLVQTEDHLGFPLMIFHKQVEQSAPEGTPLH